MIPTNKIKKDIEILFESLESIHPNLYYNSNKDITKEKIRVLQNEIKDNVSEIEFYKKIGPLVASLNDGHTFCFPGKSYDKYITQGKLFFPLGIKVYRSQIIVNSVLCTNKQIQEGDIIDSINGISSDELCSIMKKYISGEDDILKVELLGTYFRGFLWILFNMKKNFVVEFSRNDENFITTLNGIDYNDLISSLDKFIQVDRKSRLEFIDDIALMTFDSFTDFDSEKNNIDAYFDEIVHQNSKRLVIDLRNNRGGDTRVGDLILSRLIDVPYRQYSNINIKISEQIKEYYRTNDFIRGYYRDYDPSILTKVEDAQIGETISVEGKYLKKSEKSIFKGEVYLLTSVVTYSSASSFVSAFKDYNIGKIVGESPGGFSNSYGDIYMFELPNSGLEITVSHKYHIRPNGDIKLSKIQPSIDIRNIQRQKVSDFIKLL